MKFPKYKTIIVDDERLARNVLATLLSDFPEIEIVGQAHNVQSAKEVIKKTNPDIVFLDIQMPNESGFDLLQKVKSDFLTIFVTAFDEFAIKAFEVNALDYILKPVNKERLRNTINRLTSKTKTLGNITEITYQDKLLLHVEGFVKFITVSSIVMICADKDYSLVHTEEGNTLRVLRTMKAWESKLPPNNFLRIRRSAIINLEKITDLNNNDSSGLQLILASIPQPVKVSRRFAGQLTKKFRV